MNKQWITQQNYNHDRKRVNYNSRKKEAEGTEMEEQFLKKTVPGQALSIKELVDRHEKGRPIPQE